MRQHSRPYSLYPKSNGAFRIKFSSKGSYELDLCFEGITPHASEGKFLEKDLCS